MKKNDKNTLAILALLAIGLAWWKRKQIKRGLVKARQTIETKKKIQKIKPTAPTPTERAKSVVYGLSYADKPGVVAFIRPKAKGGHRWPLGVDPSDLVIIARHPSGSVKVRGRKSGKEFYISPYALDPKLAVSIQPKVTKPTVTPDITVRPKPTPTPIPPTPTAPVVPTAPSIRPAAPIYARHYAPQVPTFRPSPTPTPTMTLAPAPVTTFSAQRRLFS